MHRKHYGACCYRHICHIKNAGLKNTKINMKKIGDLAIHYSIKNISNATT